MNIYNLHMSKLIGVKDRLESTLRRAEALIPISQFENIWELSRIKELHDIITEDISSSDRQFKNLIENIDFLDDQDEMQVSALVDRTKQVLDPISIEATNICNDIDTMLSKAVNKDRVEPAE
ncbi:hypothetical protein GCM10011338_16680 [Alteromonas lipolytica]|nr:hypothetical protein GCM10011338_16680 [Alteromonas lipolytica]